MDLLSPSAAHLRAKFAAPTLFRPWTAPGNDEVARNLNNKLVAEEIIINSAGRSIKYEKGTLYCDAIVKQLSRG